MSPEVGGAVLSTQIVDLVGNGEDSNDSSASVQFLKSTAASILQAPPSSLVGKNVAKGTKRRGREEQKENMFAIFNLKK